MDHRTRSLAGIVLAALAGGQARAQSVAFGPPVAVPTATPPVQVALASWTSPPAPDLLVGEPRVGVPSSAFLYRRGDLASVPFPWAPPLTAGTCFTAGSWVGPGVPVPAPCAA